MARNLSAQATLTRSLPLRTSLGVAQVAIRSQVASQGIEIVNVHDEDMVFIDYYIYLSRLEIHQTC
jgi:hypothetical protein